MNLTSCSSCGNTPVYHQQSFSATSVLSISCPQCKRTVSYYTENTKLESAKEQLVKDWNKLNNGMVEE